MRDTCGLLIAGQGAARGDRRATGDLQVGDPGRVWSPALLGAWVPAAATRFQPTIVFVQTRSVLRRGDATSWVYSRLVAMRPLPPDSFRRYSTRRA